MKKKLFLLSILASRGGKMTDPGNQVDESAFNAYHFSSLFVVFPFLSSFLPFSSPRRPRDQKWGRECVSASLLTPACFGLVMQSYSKRDQPKKRLRWKLRFCFLANYSSSALIQMCHYLFTCHCGVSQVFFYLKGPQSINH